MSSVDDSDVPHTASLSTNRGVRSYHNIMTLDELLISNRQGVKETTRNDALIFLCPVYSVTDLTNRNR